jgi:hypothetical protein
MVEEGLVNCEEVTQRLPWLFNHSLPAEEDQQARAHVGSCASCTRELDQVRLAAQVFGAHLSPASLVQLAWDRPLTEMDAGLAYRHLESCVSCSGELALARESRGLEAQARPRAFPAASMAWRWGALAAALPLAFVGGMAWRATPDSPSTAIAAAEKQGLQARIAALQSEIQREQERGLALKQQVGRLTGPQPNVPVVEVFPDSLALRSTRASQNRVVVGADAAWVVLLLSPEKARSGPVVVEVRDQSGSTIWRGSGLRPGPLGGYTLAVPSTLLPDGRYAIGIATPGGRTLDRYALEVSRAE